MACVEFSIQTVSDWEVQSKNSHRKGRLVLSSGSCVGWDDDTYHQWVIEVDNDDDFRHEVSYCFDIIKSDGCFLMCVFSLPQSQVSVAIQLLS